MRLKTLKITILPVFCIFVFMIICSIPSVNSLYQLHDFKNIRIGGVFHDAETKNHFLVRNQKLFDTLFFLFPIKKIGSFF